MVEDMKHQKAVRRIVNGTLKSGVSPSSISISGIQNPDLEDWCAKKGVIFDKKQKVDIIETDIILLD